MRIAQIDPSLFTWPYDSALSLALAEAGHEVRIFGRPPRPAEKGPARALLDPHFYKELANPVAEKLPRPVFLGWKGLSHTYGMSRLLMRLREFKPDVIHFQWAPLPVVDRLFVPALRRIAKTVLTVHDSSPFNGAPGASVQLAGAIAIMSSFDRVIVHTEAAKQRLVSYGLEADHVRRVPHGPLEGSSVVVPRRERNPLDPIEILMFGLIKPYKGADVLLRAAAVMSRQALQKARIRIIGKPMMDLAPLVKIIEEGKIAEYVRIEPRFVPDEEVGELFSRADIVALPYREIDASGVLMTAITAGIPIVASRVGLFAELLEDGKHGSLLKVEDHHGLARALEALVLSDERRAEVSANVKALHASIPSWASIAHQTVSLYNELLTPERPRPTVETVQAQR